tara:strand:+ start:669 stop:1448 length:780 start_codon:yes stop_codon:yes gene_type:complete
MIHYKEYSNKKSKREWVTFVHGAGGSSAIWKKQIPFFSKAFNLLLVDLSGHGYSKSNSHQKSSDQISFESILNDVLEVLDKLNIKKSHFIGISLGTVIINQLVIKEPNRILKMVLGGATLELNFMSRFMMYFAYVTKSIVPYMWLYQLYAFIVMPSKTDMESRKLFIKEAKRMNQKEVARWFKLTPRVLTLLKFFKNIKTDIPTLYIMGNKDYMFLSSIKKIVKTQPNAILEIFKNCGHVVNIENPDKFNNTSLKFLKD